MIFVCKDQKYFFKRKYFLAVCELILKLIHPGSDDLVVHLLLIKCSMSVAESLSCKLNNS